METFGLAVIGVIVLFAVIRYAVKFGVEDALIEMEKRKQGSIENNK
jgi:hypothetical protein